jgi:hypothetical protein
MNTADDWVLKLYALLLRYPQLGALADVAGMSRAEQWGLYCHLLRLAES